MPRTTVPATWTVSSDHGDDCVTMQPQVILKTAETPHFCRTGFESPLRYHLGIKTGRSKDRPVLICLGDASEHTPPGDF